MRRDYSKINPDSLNKFQEKEKPISALEAKRAYKREYMKRWRKLNPEKVKQNECKYWERKARSQ